MAAEILATELDLPMYRIDLSQVVNKYIGETEKNLKRVFDAADVSDMILFFDEADALFGRRTEVSDAHDRYANLEISYLLERMERFKGLAILATNRKKDLDEAFLRRLRYIVDFPLPDAAERRKIWRQVIPGVRRQLGRSTWIFSPSSSRWPAATSARSCSTPACSAPTAPDCEARRPARLTMKAIVVAVKREYDKMNRALSLEQFGAYAPHRRGAGPCVERRIDIDRLEIRLQWRPGRNRAQRRPRGRHDADRRAGAEALADRMRHVTDASTASTPAPRRSPPGAHARPTCGGRSSPASSPPFTPTAGP